MLDLNRILDHTDLTGIHRPFHPTAAEQAILRNTWTEHSLRHIIWQIKKTFGKFKKTEITSNTFSY